MAEGFYLDGPNPSGDGNPFRGLHGSNPYTYVALTNWRAITGYLANGNFASYPYSTTDVEINRIGSKGYVTFFNETFKNIGSPLSSSTYEFPNPVLLLLHDVKGASMPSENESTKIRLTRIGWGEGPLADLARLKSGREFQLVEVCSRCNSQMIADADIEQNPEKRRSQCGSCLRIQDR